MTAPVKPEAQAVTLLPCPFCGSEPRVSDYVEHADQTGEREGYAAVQCRNCTGGESGVFCGAHCDSVEEASAAWNLRTADQGETGAREWALPMPWADLPEPVQLTGIKAFYEAGAAQPLAEAYEAIRLALLTTPAPQPAPEAELRPGLSPWQALSEKAQEAAVSALRWHIEAFPHDYVREPVILCAEVYNAAHLPAQQPRQDEPGDEDTLTCFACEQPIKDGDLVLEDINEGLMHRACCGPERDAFVNLETGEPLKDNEPIPEGWIYHVEPPAASDRASGVSDAARTAAIFAVADLIEDQAGRGTLSEEELHESAATYVDASLETALPHLTPPTPATPPSRQEAEAAVDALVLSAWARNSEGIADRKEFQAARIRVLDLMVGGSASREVENNRMRRALQPFAQFAERFGETARDDSWQITRNPSGTHNLTMGDVRAARIALATPGADDAGGA